MTGNLLKVLTGTVSATALLLGGCSGLDNLAQVGEAMPLTRIQNPKAAPNYRKVSMPMPRRVAVKREANSLWRTGSRAFFRDQRAAKVGDIVTIDINIEDTAKFNNTTKRSRANDENAGIGAFSGYKWNLQPVVPTVFSNENTLKMESGGKSEGTGSIDRNETVKLKVAAVVTQVLPNGNLVVHGRQEMRVNYELRELQVAGVIRRQDITSTNTIGFDKIAEARIAYGGRGHITQVQQPRYGQQVYDIIFPF